MANCRHIYELVGQPICPDCGRDTHEIDNKEQSRLFKKHYASGAHLNSLCPMGGTIRGWWSI